MAARMRLHTAPKMVRLHQSLYPARTPAITSADLRRVAGMLRDLAARLSYDADLVAERGDDILASVLRTRRLTAIEYAVQCEAAIVPSKTRVRTAARIALAALIA